MSNLGRVRSWFDSHGNKRVEPFVLSGYDNGTGYLLVQLYKDKKYKQLLIHRLVVEAFIGPIPKGMQVNHIDENKKNNCLSNLEIVSPKQNNNHGTRNARAGKSISKHLDLMEVQFPYREFSFVNSCEASTFFNYKNKCQVGVFIYNARKNNSNIIRIKGRDYYFSQE